MTLGNAETAQVIVRWPTGAQPRFPLDRGERLHVVEEPECSNGVDNDVAGSSDFDDGQKALGSPAARSQVVLQNAADR